MSITVFLADDHAVLRDGLKFMLEAQPDIDVVGDAADGRAALEQILRLTPDVAVLDIAMPVLSGLEVARQLGQMLPDVKVIILSMHHTPEHINQALQIGARGYLLKESASDEVIEAVRQVDAGRRYLSQEISEQVLKFYLDPAEGDAEPDPLEDLTDRERQVLYLVVEGKTTAEISDLLSLSPKTIKSYRSRLMQKVAVDNVAELVKFAIRRGVISLK